MKLIAGLGNFDATYDGTRHNLGSRIVTHFVATYAQTSWKFEKNFSAFTAKIPATDGPWLFLKSNGYMNHSGTPIAKVCHFFKIPPPDVYILCDDFTIPLGSVKITERSGDAGHNGVKDILQKIGPGFIRFRVGIGPKPYPNMSLADYVLSKFSPEERLIIDRKMPLFCQNLKLLLDKGVSSAMNVVNRTVCRQDPTEQL